MIISIGILAWNEEPSIGKMIDSLAAQSLLRDPGEHAIEVVVVPNGCHDDTAGAARRAIGSAAWPAPAVTGRVVELAQPGKTNAWNVYVHEISRPDAEVLVLADADILFHGDETLRSMIGVLESDPHVLAATDEPIKDIALLAKPGFKEKISIAMAGMTKAAPGQLTGQLYAARASALRRLVMPGGLIIDDGFIKQMLCTDFLRQPLDHSRIRRAENAAHVFEAYTRISDILPNQRRQAAGHAIYSMLRDRLLAVRESGGDPESWLKEKCRDEPDWFRDEVRRRVREGGRWVMPRGMAGARWRRWRRLPAKSKPGALPALLAGGLVDAITLVWANQTLRQGKLKGIWKDTRSEKLGQPTA